MYLKFKYLDGLMSGSYRLQLIVGLGGVLRRTGGGAEQCG